MKIRKTISLLSLLVIFTYPAYSQTHDKEYKLFVTLENAPFDSLFLHDYTVGRDLLFASKKIKEFTWEITMPDSIVWDYENMELVVSNYDSVSKLSRNVRFITERDGKEIIVANVGVEDKSNYIHATYRGKTVFPDVLLTNNQGSGVVGDLIYEDFNLIVQDDNSDMTVRSQDPFFSWFMNFNGEGTSYDEHLASYNELSKRHPDSRFLMSNLAANLKQYKSRKDVQTIYDNLSDKHKNTRWAKNIEQFLSGKFKNTSLTTADKNIEEDLVQDTSKINLVVFSASWCAPCIAEIPLLKEIYKDLNKNLILTFVSMDNEKGIASFQKLIDEKDIPWRTLFAYKDVKEIEQKYFVQSIPHNILIYPNGEMEIIDVRNDEQRAKLYSMVKPLEN